MENLNEEREIRTDKEMIKRKYKIEKKMAENLNKEREGRTDKVMKKKEEERTKSRKKERLLGNFCHCIHACLSSKKGGKE